MFNQQVSLSCVKFRRLLYSIWLSLVLFIVMFFDLAAIPNDGASSSIYSRILESLHTYGLVGNIVTLSLIGSIYIWFFVFKDKLFSYSKSLNAISVFFGLLNTSALFLFYRDTLPVMGFASLAVFFFHVYGWSVAFIILARVFLLILDHLSSADHLIRNNPAFFKYFDHHAFLVSFFIIILAWAPWIISYYPASMEWDVYDPIMRYLGQRPASNLTPWFYTAVIGSAYQLGCSMGNKNLGVFIYIVIRAILMAMIYARCVVLQKQSGLPKLVCLLTIVYFAFTPIWGAYAKHAFKDTISAALFCWYVTSLINVIQNVNSNCIKAIDCIEHGAAGLFSALFRNNLVYVVIPITTILFIWTLGKKTKIRYYILLLSGIICFGGYQYYLYNIAGIAHGSMNEALSIVFQQTARTVKYHSKTITEEEKEIIDACLVYDSLRYSYDPIISDPVKNVARGNDEEMKQYLITWAKMFFKYPKSYTEAFIAHSSGYYAFTPEYTEEQRYGPGSHANVGMTVFNWVEDSRFDDSLLCHYSERFSAARRFLDTWPEIWHQIPLLNLTDIKPLYTWAVVLMCWLFLTRKEYLKLIPVFAWLLMMLTCVASPVNDCFRYFAPAAAAFPVLYTTTITKKDIKVELQRKDKFQPARLPARS